MNIGRPSAVFLLSTSLILSVCAGADEVIPPVVESETEAAPAPAPAADLTPVVDVLNTLDAAVARIDEAMKRQTVSTAAAIDELKAEIAQLREAADAATRARPSDAHTSKALDEIQSQLTGLERVLGLGPDSTKTALTYPRLAAILGGLAALLSLIVIVGVFWIRPGGRSGGGASIPGKVSKQIAEIRESVAALASAPAGRGDGKPGDDGTAVAIVQTTNALRATAEKAERENRGLSELVQQFRDLGASLQTSLDSLGARATEIGQSRAEGEAADAAKLAELEETARAVGKQIAVFDSFWPEPFRGDGQLAPWKERIIASFDKGSAEAGALLNALIDWQLLRHEREANRERWVAAVDAVGRACLAFLAKEPVENDSEALERAQLWTRVFKTVLEERFPALKLSAVYPGDRFDTDRMEAVGSSSGGRQSVQRGLSWAILEKSAESTRILKRAQVITA